MPKRALLERRPWLLASLITAIAYFLLKDATFPGLYLYVLEAAALMLLGAYALLRHSGRDARAVAGFMGASGIGVVSVELDFYIGALVLMLALALGIGLFVKHRRANLETTQKAAAVALLLLTPLICWRLPFERTDALTFGIFGLALGGMAATAWASRFPRYRVGLGGLLIVGAGIVTIGRAGPLHDSEWPGMVAWPLFYLGHFLICTGAIQTLRGGLVQKR